ncbi:MAG: sugar ABC transporter ATP-binding protein [Xanthobacteraceae bacterium]
MHTPLLELRDLRKDFSGVQVLKGISLAFERGEVHGVLGENGAGKSTLIKILTGVYTHSSGTILLEGNPIVVHKPVDAHALGLGAVYQDAELAGSFTVAENILLGNEPGRFWVNRRRIREEARDILEQIGLPLDPDRPASTLTAAEMQMVTLATLFHRRYKLIVLDEPTARLSAHESAMLFALIERFKQEGIAIIYISHRLNEVRQLCDRATILRDGKVSGTLLRGDIDEDVVTQLMVNRSAADLEIENEGLAREQVVLRLDSLATSRLAPLSLDVHAGEILGITGPVGAGMEQIEKSLGGLCSYGGQILIDGTVREIRTPSDALRAGIALIPEERRKQALFPNLSLAENVSLPALDRLARFGFVSNGGKRRYAEGIIDRLSVHPKMPDRPIRYFSGGNQQKAVIGKWLERKARVYVFVEPTSGVDVGAIRQIYEIILGVAASGAAVIVISTSIKELLALAQTILVVHDGAVTACRPRRGFDRDSLLAMAIGKRESSADTLAS